MTRFNIPTKNKRVQSKTPPRTIIISPDMELYPFVFDQLGKKRPAEEILSILLYATDSVIQAAIAKGIIDRNPVEIFEAADANEKLINFIHNKAV